MPLASHWSRTFEAVDERLGVEPGAAAAEVLEAQGLEGDAVRLAVEGEGLDDAVLAVSRRAIDGCVSRLSQAH